MKNRIIYIFFVTLILLTACTTPENGNDTENEQPVNGLEDSVAVSKEEALQIVREHVQQEEAIIEYYHETQDAFVIHAFEDHTEGKLTFHWYDVDRQTGDIVETADKPSKVIGDTSEEIKALSFKIISALKEKDMKTVAEFMDEDKGLLFSPYVYVDEHALVFTADQVKQFFEDNTVYTWGIYDGKGDPIELTPSEYFERFVYNANYVEADELVYDEDVSRGNLLNNLKEHFDHSVVVEFHVKGTEQYGGMDWQSVRLVFDITTPEAPKLIAIVNDEWTT